MHAYVYSYVFTIRMYESNNNNNNANILLPLNKFAIARKRCNKASTKIAILLLQLFISQDDYTRMKNFIFKSIFHGLLF